jgi:hypothetical protein
VATVAVTGGALALLHATTKSPSRALEVAVLIAASAAATATRYLTLRFWVFAAQRPRRAATS